MKTTRRNFLKTMSASTAVATVPAVAVRAAETLQTPTTESVKSHTGKWGRANMFFNDAALIIGQIDKLQRQSMRVFYPDTQIFLIALPSYFLKRLHEYRNSPCLHTTYDMIGAYCPSGYIMDSKLVEVVFKDGQYVSGSLPEDMGAIINPYAYGNPASSPEEAFVYFKVK